jgi:virulence factor Mce-like protein
VRTGRQINRFALGSITIVVGLVVVLGVMAGLIGPQMFSGGGRTVTAVFTNAEQLIPGNEVRMQGVLEGTVQKVRLGPGARSASVTMTVADSAGPLYRNATATIAWKTLLGGAFNINLSRGDPGAGPLGSHVIPASQTFDQVELDNLLSFDSGAARRGLRTLPGQLAVALGDPKPPSQVLGALADVSPVVATGVGAVRGQVPDRDLRSFVSGAEQTVKALDAPNDLLRGLVQGAAATLSVTAARATDIKSALDEATPSMQQLITTFSQLNTTLQLANPLLQTLQGPVADVAPTVARLYPTVVGARDLLDRAVPLLHALAPAVTSLKSAAIQGLPLLNALTPSINRLANTVLPYMNTIDPATQHTTAQMIGPTTEALGPDIAGQMDQNGHFIRFPATAGSSPVYLPCQIYAGNPAAKQVIACQSLQQMLQAFLNYNPFDSSANESGSGAGGGGGAARAGSAGSAHSSKSRTTRASGR